MNLSDKNVKFSIILTVYNGEEYIDEAIQSVLNQTYHNYELIIINDGSTDQTNQIVKGYEHSCIKIITKQNEGVSTARNIGMTYASGDYLMFIDSDDKLRVDALEVLYTYIKKYTSADLIIYGWEEFGVKKNINKVSNEVKIYDADLCAQKIIQTDSECGGGFPWNKLWNINSIRKNGSIPEFNPELILCEDKEWAVRQLLSCKTVMLVPDILYLYRKAKTGHLSNVDFNAVESKNNEKLVSFMKASIYIEDNISELRPNTSLARMAKLSAIEKIVLICYKSIKNQNEELQRKGLKFLDKYKIRDVKNIHVKYLIMYTCVKIELLKNKVKSYV